MVYIVDSASPSSTVTCVCTLLGTCVAILALLHSSNEDSYTDVRSFATAGKFNVCLAILSTWASKGELVVDPQHHSPLEPRVLIQLPTI